MNKFIYYVLSACLGFSFSACNSVLDTQPTGEVAPPTVFATTDNAYYAVNGLNLLTVKQYLESQGFNGEGTIKLWYGEYTSDTFVKDLPGWAPIINTQYMSNTTSIYLYYPWYYYYRIIGDANVIIDNVDDAIGLDEDKMEIKARALCYRAYSYFMLSQLYCNRWIDSNNGASQGLILRLTSNTPDEYPFSTLAEVYDQIYLDLDTAIDYFTQSDYGRSDYFEMSKEAAYAIYARAALTRNDFEKAAQMAPLARAGYPLMNVNEYKSGFNKPTSEWIWGSYGAVDQNLYYYSYHAYLAFDANTGVVRSYPLCISKELYNKIPETDIRRSLWYAPKNPSETPGTISNEDEIKAIRSAHPTLLSTAVLSYYMHFKFSVADQPGVGSIPHFRSSEMYLIEAEALVRQNKGRDQEAQALMVALIKDSGRDPSYTCTKTGEDLLDEIETYRAIELWGEGFRWFDLKRTNKPMIRESRATGGSYLASLTVTKNPSDNNGWTWSIPERETDYNTLAQPSN